MRFWDISRLYFPVAKKKQNKTFTQFLHQRMSNKSKNVIIYQGLHVYMFYFKRSFFKLKIISILNENKIKL